MNDANETVATNPGRRDFLRRASVGAAATLGAPYVWAQRTDETLIVNTFGGEYQELFEKTVLQPFEKKFGVKVIHDATGTSSQDSTPADLRTATHNTQPTCSRASA